MTPVLLQIVGIAVAFPLLFFVLGLLVVWLEPSAADLLDEKRPLQIIGTLMMSGAVVALILSLIALATGFFAFLLEALGFNNPVFAFAAGLVTVLGSIAWWFEFRPSR